MHSIHTLNRYLPKPDKFSAVLRIKGNLCKRITAGYEYLMGFLVDCRTSIQTDQEQRERESGGVD